MTIDQSNEASIADPTYIIKCKVVDKVIDMKQLEALKKRLPKGIDVRVSSGNVLTFRARFRRRGYPFNKLHSDTHKCLEILQKLV